MKRILAILIAYFKQFFKPAPLPEVEQEKESLDSGTGFGDS